MTNSKPLTSVKIRSLTKPGRYRDERGLYLQIDAPRDDVKDSARRRSWLFRYMLNGHARSMGLGPYPEVSLAEAREKAFDCRKLLVRGIDPLASRPKRSGMTFESCAEEYVSSHSSGWRSETHKEQWATSLRDHINPVIGKTPVEAIDTDLVLKILKPIWDSKTETASRVRGRIEAVLDWAAAHKYRQGDNPARWRGHLNKLLPHRSKVRAVKHYEALPYRELPAFLIKLRSQDNLSARALEFIILTAARTGEAIEARFSEVNQADRVWTVPAGRMKSGREHRVPLSAPALALLKPGKDFLFQLRRGKPLSKSAIPMMLHRMGLSVTVHGFRSTFRDWAAETTDFSSEVVEMALAHAVGDKTEAAYRRGDLFEKRRELMNAWTQFCLPEI
jgi:integrase